MTTTTRISLIALADTDGFADALGNVRPLVNGAIIGTASLTALNRRVPNWLRVPFAIGNGDPLLVDEAQPAIDLDDALLAKHTARRGNRRG